MNERYRPERRTLEHAVLKGPGTVEPALRVAAAAGDFGALPAELEPLLRKVREHAYKVTDEDMEALRSKYSDDELFELVVSATLGAARLRLEAGLAALEDA